MANPKPQARGKVRIHKGSLELSAYAGVNPATGKKARIYDHLPLDAPQKEIQRRLSALVTKGDELAAIRARRRKDGVHVDLEPVRAGRNERTVRHALETWWNAHGHHLQESGTARTYLDSYLLPELGDVATWRLRPALDAGEAERDPDLVDLSAFYARLGETGRVGRPGKDGRYTGKGGALEPATIHKAHRYLRAALALDVRQGRLPANPALEVKLPRIGERESTTPEADELAAFLPFLGGEGRVREPHTVTRRHRGGGTVTYTVPARPVPGAVDVGRSLVAFALLVASGPRPQEVAALTRGDYDAATGRLSLRGAGVVRIKEKGRPERWELQRGETEKRRKRTITLDAHVREALDAHLRAQDAKALTVGVALGRRAWLFSQDLECSAFATPGAIGQAFERIVGAAVKAGIDVPPGMRLYDMRHFGITQLLAKGRNPRAVAERFGTSEEMIRRTYNHAIFGDDDRLAESMGEVWASVLPAAVGGEVVPLRRR